MFVWETSSNCMELFVLGFWELSLKQTNKQTKNNLKIVQKQNKQQPKKSSYSG